MARTGLLLIAIGVMAWYWAGGELEKLGTYPADAGVVEAFQNYPAARMETLRYAGGALAMFGVILTLLPARRF